MIKNIALVALGGSVGSVFRYLTSEFVSRFYIGLFPMGTFAVNILGCFIIGVLIQFSCGESWFDNNLRLLLITGFCGGYTTFSAFSAENVALFQSGHFWIMMLYISASVILGIMALYAGIVLTRLAFGQ